jgi:enterochelin esterase family protein
MTRKLLKRLQSQGAPLIDGHTATFVWQGRHAPALAGDFNDWNEASPAQLTSAGADLWTYQLKLAPDAYIEYAYFFGAERVDDPFNPQRVSNGMGKYNQYFYMPEAAPHPLTIRNPETPRGEVTRHVLAGDDLDMIVGRQRTVYLYKPPVRGRCPLLVVWDGRDYLQKGRLPIIVDNLIAAGRIQPLALALVNNAGRARTVEYSCSEGPLNFVLNHVLPLAEQHLKLVSLRKSPGAYGVLGASMGGLMALFTGLRLPEVFGKVLSQSGAFGIEDYEYGVFDLMRSHKPRPLQLWLDIGQYDMPALLASNERMHTLLTEKGYTAPYRVYPGGHNYTAWRNDLWRGLEYLFPPRPAKKA